MALARALIPVLLLALVAPPVVLATDTPFFAEDFETGDDGWTAENPGMSVVCEPANCALRVDPPCCGTHAHFTHALDAPLAGRVALTLAFRPDALSGDTDSSVHLLLDQGYLILHTTEWFNNGLTLQTDVGDHRDFAQYWNAGAWMHLRVLLDADRRVAQAQVVENGSVVAASDLVGINASATTLTGLRVQGVTWGNYAATFSYDDLAVGPSSADFVIDCAAPDVHFAGPAELTAPWNATFKAHVWSTCDVAGWSLDLGDGNVAQGDGSPPSEHTHAYASAGTYLVTFTVTLVDGSSYARSETVRVVSQQFIQGEVGPVLMGVELGDAGFSRLDAVAGPGDWMVLEWDALDGDLDLRFYDASGAPLGACDGGLDFGARACAAPLGAAFVRVVGTAPLGAAWSIEYRYAS